MVTHGCFPSDPRIEKESSSLLNAGYQVYVYANGNVSEQKRSSFMDENIRYFSLQYSPLFLFFILPMTLRKWFLKDGIKLVHIQDTPIALPTIIATASLKIPIVYDVHEIWSKMVAEDAFVPLFQKILLIIWNKISEVAGCRASKAVLATSDEMASYLINTYNIPREKVHVIRNVSDRIKIKGVPKIELPTNCLKVCYVGNMNSGELLLNTVIESAQYVRNRTNLRIYFVGEGKIRPQLEELTRKLHVEDCVEFTGWMPKKKAYAYILACDVCLLPYRKTFNTDVGSPHKLFEYLILGKPVMMTSLSSCVRMFGDVAFIWDPPTAKKLAQIIDKLHKDADLRHTIGEAGKALVEQKYLWEFEQKKLLKAYNTLLNVNIEK
jgi:glycosyltransferase involved in cell wall biosynthesis